MKGAPKRVVSSLELAALNTVKDGVLLVRHGFVIFSNEAFESMWNVEAKNVEFESFNFFKDVHLTKELVSEAEQVIMTQERVDRSYELRHNSIKDAMGHEIYKVEVKFTPFDQHSLCITFDLPPCTHNTAPQCVEKAQRLSYYETCDRALHPYWNVYEYDEAQQNSKCVFRSRTSEEWVNELKQGNKQSSGCELDWWQPRVPTMTTNEIIKSSFDLPNNLVLSGTARLVEVRDGKRIVLCCYEDVTSNKKIQEELDKKDAVVERMQEVSTMLQGMFDMSLILMATVQVVDGKDILFKVMNRAHKEWFRSLVPDKVNNMDDARGILGTELGMHQRGLSLCIEYILESKKTGKETRFEWVSILHPSTVFLVCCFHVKDDWYSWACQDITDRINLEKQLKEERALLEASVKSRTKELEEALQVKSRFLATMSHEIRSPLSGTIGALDLLSGNENLTEDQQDCVRIGKLCGEQLLVLVNDILDFCKIEESKMKLENIQFSLRDTVESSLEVVAIEAENKMLELIYHIQPGTQSMVMGDQVRLRQILVNLLNNAVKFSFHGEVVVSVSSSYKGGQCEFLFSVKDSGIGISESAQDQIFQPFTQADSSVTRKFGGTGLGLAISKRLTNLMGGTMWFESKKNVGSTFYFTITSSTIDHSDSIKINLQHNTLVLIHLPNAALADTLVEFSKQYGITAVKEVDKVANGNSSSKVCGVFVVYSDLDGETRASLSAIGKLVHVGYKKPTTLPQDVAFLKKPIRQSSFREVLDYLLGTGKEYSPRITRTFLQSRPIFNTKIMVAEDNVMNQRVIGRFLRSIGYHNIFMVENGRKVLDLVKRENFHIILMDIMMPEMGGLEAAEIIRSDSSILEQPVIIALTADAFESTREKCIKSGMQSVLTKPIDKEELALTLGRYT